MQGKKYFALISMILMLVLGGSTVYCTDLDSLNQSPQPRTEADSPVVTSETDEGFNTMQDVLKGTSGVDSESMAKANQLSSPIANIIGILTGVVISLTSVGIFLVTALDLAYIAIPFVRPMLNPASATGGSAPMAGGMGMGMRGGMGMGMGMQSQAQQTGTRCWVSDEAVQALAVAQPQQGGGGMAGGMGMGMGMGMQAQAQQPSGGKSAITAYLKKRAFFLVVFAIATTLLMSSLLLDCGLNLAELLYRITTMFSDGIGNVQM